MFYIDNVIFIFICMLQYAHYEKMWFLSITIWLITFTHFILLLPLTLHHSGLYVLESFLFFFSTNSKLHRDHWVAFQILFWSPHKHIWIFVFYINIFICQIYTHIHILHTCIIVFNNVFGIFLYQRPIYPFLLKCCWAFQVRRNVP